MTIEQLKHYRGHGELITRLTAELRHLQARYEQGVRTTEAVGEIAPRIVELERAITECEQARQSIKDYIASIEDPYTQVVFTMRFYDGLSWANIAYTTGFRGTSTSTLRQTVKRYLHKH
jgi:hypothetical protein